MRPPHRRRQSPKPGAALPQGSQGREQTPRQRSYVVIDQRPGCGALTDAPKRLKLDANGQVLVSRKRSATGQSPDTNDTRSRGPAKQRTPLRESVPPLGSPTPRSDSERRRSGPSKPGDRLPSAKGRVGVRLSARVGASIHQVGIRGAPNDSPPGRRSRLWQGPDCNCQRLSVCPKSTEAVARCGPWWT